MIATGVQAHTGGRADRSGLLPVVSSIGAAGASLAFFRVWGYFSLKVAGPGRLELSGAALAHEIRGTIPWLYVTPAVTVGLLVVSLIRLMEDSRRSRLIYSVALLTASIVLLAWPVRAMSKIARHFAYLQPQDAGSMRLTAWWWVYCGSLLLALLAGLLEMILNLRAGKAVRTGNA